MKKKPIFAIVFSILLTGYTVFALLDAFVIPHDTVVLSEVSTSTETTGTTETTDKNVEERKPSGGKHGKRSRSEKNGDKEDSTVVVDSEDETSTLSTEGIITETSDGWKYESENVTITITKKYIENTYVYIADVEVSDTALLKSGLAEGTLGRNITAKTSEIAEEVNAILAINGDFYGFRDTGYVMRSGYLYRETSGDSDQEDLVIYENGTMEIINESDISASELAANGAREIYSFGPGIVKDGEICIDENTEVDQSMRSNPRTAIGYYSAGHYCFVVSDGRTSESTGLSLYQLAEVMEDLGVECAYNLDGGGSSTMYFNGEVINNPTTNGNKISERSVSDIIYISH